MWDLIQTACGIHNCGVARQTKATVSSVLVKLTHKVSLMSFDKISVFNNFIFHKIIFDSAPVLDISSLILTHSPSLSLSLSLELFYIYFCVFCCLYVRITYGCKNKCSKRRIHSVR